MSRKHEAKEAPAPEQEPLTKKDVNDLKDMLMRQRDELTGQVAKLRNDAVDGSDSTNWEEDGTDAFDREFAFKMVGSRNEMLNQIDEALQKMAEDRFGICEGCNNKIGRARIRVLPFCRTCIHCQSKSEQGRVSSRAKMPR
jgi:DnaK suppressor protein